MGAWRIMETSAAVAALLCATRASGGTVVEPIARLSLEGGYDSNPLYNGRAGEGTARVSPDVGLRLHDPLWDLRGSYGGDFVYFERSAPGGIWNQRGALWLDARPTRRSMLSGNVQVAQAFDPAGLARVGVFRTGRQSALLVTGRGKVEWRADRTVWVAGTMNERTVVFDDRSGGAMHAPGAEALWRVGGHRIELGGAYGFGMFQSFVPGQPDETAFSHAIRARARWQATRHASVNAWAGPALWLPQAGSSAMVPEAWVELLLATRGLDLRTNVGRGLGLGATAHPGLVDAWEVGVERRLARRYFARGAGGFWRSGTVPRDADAVIGYAAEAEAGMRFQDGVRLSLAAANYGRLDSAEQQYARTTIGLRLGWELPVR